MYDRKLLEIDYLVFSSHKSGTQTLKGTIKRNGFICEHCHGVSNIGIHPGKFRDFLDDYANARGKKLRAISVFREPIERHISSFFQWYGSRPLREGVGEKDTIIARCSIEELQCIFVSELQEGKLVGYEDSLNEISAELQVETSILLSTKSGSQWNYVSDKFDLNIYKFDEIFLDPTAYLSRFIGKKIRLHTSNTSNEKWYRDKYRDFKRRLRVPRRTIRQTFNARKEIIGSLYEEEFGHVLERAYDRYSED